MPEKKKEDQRLFEYPEDDDFFDDGIPKGVFSPSQFDTYQRCPKQYYYRYILNLISPPGVSLIRGTALHYGAEIVHKHTIEHGSPLSLEEAYQGISDLLDRRTPEVADWEDVNPDTFKDRMLGNFNVYYRNAVPVIRPVAAEKTFAKKIGVVPMRGVIDLIDLAPGEYTLEDDPEQPPPDIEVVSDLKTGSKIWTKQRIDFDPQLTFYSMIEHTDKVRIDFLLDQKSGSRYEPKRSVRRENDRRILVEDLEEVVDLIKQGVFPRCSCTTWACTPKYCGYFEKCRGPK